MHAGSEETIEKTEGKPLVERSKALGDIRGVSYIYGIFWRFWLIEGPALAYR